MQARTLNDCLHAEETIARLTAHAEHLLKLQRIIDATLPNSLLRSCRIANYRLGIVFLHADNAAVAAKLRQLAPRLCDELRSSGREITEIRVKLQPNQPIESAAPQKNIAPLGVRTKQGLTKLSMSLPGDSPLKASLERLLKER